MPHAPHVPTAPHATPRGSTAGAVRRTRARSGVTGLALLALVLTVLTGTAAPASAATPATPDFPRTIDGYAGWETESGCDPTPKPGAVSLQALIHATYGTRPTSNISRACSASNSGHEEGRSIDWMTNGRDAQQRATADSFIIWLLQPDQYGNKHAMARRLGVSYVIWNSQIISLTGSNANWKEYSDCQRLRTGPEFDNTCHRNHVHVSLSWAGAARTTSWYTLAGQRRAACPTPATPAAPPAPTSTALGYVPVEPHRVLDTRDGTGVTDPCYVDGGARVDVRVTGSGGVPSNGVAAVVLNVTATDAKGPLWVAAYPAGAPFGGTSSVNTSTGGTAAALVTVPVGSGGKVSLRTGGLASDLVADVVGYHPASGSGARYRPLEGRRVFDGRVPPGGWNAVAAGVPAEATAVAANVTSVGDGPGYLTLAPGVPAATRVPGTSSVNMATASATANRSVMGLQGGWMSLYSSATGRGVVDVTGYYSPTGAGYHPLTPVRVVDTRNGTGGLAPLAGGTEAVVQIGGRGGVPAGASAVVVTMTVDGASTPTHLTSWATGRPKPATSDVNAQPGLPTANMAIVPLDSAGRFSLALNAGRSDVILDVLGYYGRTS